MTTGNENKTKRFELTLITHRIDGDWKIDSVDKLLADDLVQLMTQFTLLIVRLQQKVTEEDIRNERIKDDDIPF